MTLPRDQLQQLGTQIGTSLTEGLALEIWAFTLQMWYLHLVVRATSTPVRRIVRSAEEAVRASLDMERPIWEERYDKRFCFDGETVRERIAYVERNNVAVGLPAKPWPFIEAPDF